jgi:iron(III) transport system permease protein
VALLLVLGYLILVPVGTVVWGSLRDGPPGTDASYTLGNYASAFGDSRLYRAAWNTFVFAFGSSILALALGTYLAWLTQRTNVRFKGLISALALLPVLLPGTLNAVAWVLLLSPKIGWVNGYASSWFGAGGPIVDSYSMIGMIWAQGVDHISLPFLLVAAALRGMDPSLEEQSRAAGGGTVRTLFRVTFPLVRPAVLATGLLLFLRGIESFEVPAIMGIPAKIPVFATVVWQATLNSPDYSLAATYAVGYVAVALLGLWLYYRSMRETERFATVSGKAFRPRVVELGRSRTVHAAVAAVILAVAVLLPLMVIIWASLQTFFTRIDSASIRNLNLDSYRTVLDSSTLVHSFVNSVQVGIVSSVLCVLLAAVTSWTVIRTRIRGRKVLDAIAFLPFSIPGLVMGLAILWLYGTLGIIGVAFVACYLPVALRATHASLAQIDAELEEASKASGGSWLRTFVRINLPLMTPGLVVAFVFVLTQTFKGLSVPIMVYTSGNEVIPVVLYSAYQSGQYSQLSAIGVLLIVVLLALSGIAYAVGRRLGGVQTHVM